MKSEEGREDKEGHDAWAAMVLGVSQPTLALGRQTSNCHVGQDYEGGDEDDVDDLVMMMMKMTCVAWSKVK